MKEFATTVMIALLWGIPLSLLGLFFGMHISIVAGRLGDYFLLATVPVLLLWKPAVGISPLTAIAVQGTYWIVMVHLFRKVVIPGVTRAARSMFGHGDDH